jgi:nicotinamidase-related amidase
LLDILQDNDFYENKSVRNFLKNTFGSIELAEAISSNDYDEIEICGVCTDICVISNTLLIKAALPNAKISVLKDLCAGVTPESHETALKAMAACHINIV